MSKIIKAHSKASIDLSPSATPEFSNDFIRKAFCTIPDTAPIKNSKANNIHWEANASPITVHTR